MELTPRKIAIHVGLFLLTFITTTLAGTEWVYGKSILISGYTFDDFLLGMPYSVPFLLILSAHEFGHYFTAIHYRVRTTLPYYLPLPPFPFMIGTLGAVIRLKSRVPSRTQSFDIGIAGPLAGLVVAIGVLWYGFATLPPIEYLYQFHPDYAKMGTDFASKAYPPEGAPNVLDVKIGKSLLYWFMEKLAVDPSRVPNIHEIMHYPYLLAGLLSLIITSMNLLPVGQLDGGHVLYGLLGTRGHRRVASVVFLAVVFYSGLGTIEFFGPHANPFWQVALYLAFLYFTLVGMRLTPQDTLMYTMLIFTGQFLLGWFVPGIKGFPGWLLFTFIVSRFAGIEHPPSEIEEPLDPARQALGWLALFIFVITFVPVPIEFITYEKP